MSIGNDIIPRRSPMAKPTPAQVAEAKRELDENRSLIVLHTLYQRWGLSTKLLKPLFDGRNQG